MREKLDFTPLSLPPVKVTFLQLCRLCIIDRSRSHIVSKKRLFFSSSAAGPHQLQILFCFRMRGSKESSLHVLRRPPSVRHLLSSLLPLTKRGERGLCSTSASRLLLNHYTHSNGFWGLNVHVSVVRGRKHATIWSTVDMHLEGGSDSKPYIHSNILFPSSPSFLSNAKAAAETHNESLERLQVHWRYAE